MYIKDSRISKYQDFFLQFNWFQPLLIGLATYIDRFNISIQRSLNQHIENQDYTKIMMTVIFMYLVKQLKNLTIHLLNTIK